MDAAFHSMARTQDNQSCTVAPVTKQSQEQFRGNGQNGSRMAGYAGHDATKAVIAP
jgi:hypothetical protein